jgi:hypothetical protein
MEGPQRMRGWRSDSSKVFASRRRLAGSAFPLRDLSNGLDSSDAP